MDTFEILIASKPGTHKIEKIELRYNGETMAHHGYQYLSVDDTDKYDIERRTYEDLEYAMKDWRLIRYHD